MNEGKITFTTALDNDELEKQLNSLTKKIENLENKIAQKQAERMPLVDQAKQLVVELDLAKAKLYEMQNAPVGTFSSDQIKEQQLHVNGLQAEWNRVQGKVESYDTAIQNATIELDRNKEKAGMIVQELASAGKGSHAMDDAVKKAEKSMARFGMRLREVIRSALIFTVITRALAGLRDWLGKVIKTNDEANVALARLKAALLTLAQPLVNVVIPAFTAFVNVLTKIVTAIAAVMSALFGSTINQSKEAAKSLNSETDAIEGTGDAAKDASKSMAAFDEINQVGGGNSGSGSGGGSSTTTAPDFSGIDTSGLESNLDKILGVVKLIGTAFIYWQLPKALQGGLKTVLGLFLALDGAIGLVGQTLDAWTNGVDWDNFWGMLMRSAEMILGLWLAFGKMGAGIGIVVAGIALLVTGFYDAMKNGWDLQNTLMSIAGVIMTGLGIALLTGSWIPLLIAGIAALLLAITVAWGHGDELIAGAKNMLQGFLDFFKGVFTGDISTAIIGIKEIFTGLKTAIFAIVDSLKEMFNSFLDWLDEKTGGRLSGIIEFVRGLFNGVFDWFKTSLGVAIDAARQIFEGLTIFLAGVFTGDWDAAWDGVQRIFKGVWNGIIGVLETAVNAIIEGINWLISQMNKIQFDVPSWVPGIGGKSIGIDIPSIDPIKIPPLATGAVIPPNREFLALLGDQKSGTNIEAPLDTIVQAVMLALSKSGYSGGGQVIENVLNLDGEVVYKNQQRVSRRHGAVLA